MRKFAIALGAIAFTLGAANVAAFAQSAPTPAKSTTEAPAPKRKVVKKVTTTKTITAKYQSRCKAGQVWDASASLNTGACVKRSAKVAKVKVKSAPKAAAGPAAPAPKKVS